SACSSPATRCRSSRSTPGCTSSSVGAAMVASSRMMMRRSIRSRSARDQGPRAEGGLMLVVTTPVVPERRTVRTLGIVSGDAILGANLFKDLFAGIRDIVGGRSAAYEQELRKAKEIALQEMENEAESLGANAVVSVDLDYET